MLWMTVGTSILAWLCGGKLKRWVDSKPNSQLLRCGGNKCRCTRDWCLLWHKGGELHQVQCWVELHQCRSYCSIDPVSSFLWCIFLIFVLTYNIYGKVVTLIATVRNLIVFSWTMYTIRFSSFCMFVSVVCGTRQHWMRFFFAAAPILSIFFRRTFEVN